MIKLKKIDFETETNRELVQWKRDTHQILKPRVAENNSKKTDLKLLRIAAENQDLK